MEPELLSFTARPPEEIVGSYTIGVKPGQTIPVPPLDAAHYAACAVLGRGTILTDNGSLDLPPRQWITFPVQPCSIRSDNDSELVVSFLTLDVT